MSGPIRAVVFDIGGVVMGSPLAAIAEFERAHGLPEDYVNVNVVTRGRSGAFHRAERGEISVEDLVREWRVELESEEDWRNYKQFAASRVARNAADAPVWKRRLSVATRPSSIDAGALFHEMMEKGRTPDISFLHALLLLRGSRYAVGALTNNFKSRTEEGGKSFPWFLRELFDDVVESAVVGLRKPDPAIFHMACERLGVLPSETVFLDDIGANLKGARAAGLHTIRVHLGRGDDALRELHSVLASASPACSLASLLPSDSGKEALCFPAGNGGGLITVDVFGCYANPPVVLLHGGGQTRHSWKSTGEVLAAHGFFAVAVDLKGHGDAYHDDSGDPARYYEYMFARDLDSLVKMMGLSERRPVLIGASLGGLAVLLAECRLKAGACVVVDVAVRLEASGKSRILTFMGDTAEEGFATLEEAAAAVERYKGRERQGSLEGLKKNLRPGADGRWRWHWDPAFLTTRPWMRDPSIPAPDIEGVAFRARSASMIKAPTLLVRGSRSDVLSEEGMVHFRTLVPHVQFADVSGAYHMVAGDDNDPFMEAVLSFLLPQRSALLMSSPWTSQTSRM